jgi:hypothetical protein
LGAATIGILVSSAGMKMPVVIIAGFLPMFFAAYAYRELNKVASDCGTSFTWTTKAFGPYVGWIGGWAAVLATVIVPSKGNTGEANRAPGLRCNSVLTGARDVPGRFRRTVCAKDYLSA